MVVFHCAVVHTKHIQVQAAPQCFWRLRRCLQCLLMVVHPTQNTHNTRSAITLEYAQEPRE